MSERRDWFDEIAENICANLGDRKLVLWGFYQPSFDFSEYLRKKYNLDVAMYVDGNRDLVDEVRVCLPESLENKSNEYYVVILLAYSPYISKQIREWGYKNQDYYYFNDCIIQYDSELYLDKHGNRVIRPPRNVKFVFMGYDNFIEFSKDYSYFSKVTVTAKSNNRLTIESDGEYRNINIYLLESNEIKLDKNVQVINSSLTLCDYNKMIVREKSKISDSDIRLIAHNCFSIGNESFYQGNTKLVCATTLTIGDYCKIVSDNTAHKSGTIKFGNNVRIGATKNEQNAFVQKNIFTISAYGTCIIGDGCLFSIGIKILCGDGHAIFDTDTGAKVNLSENEGGNRIVLAKHVWIGEDVTLLQGTDIGAGSIVGTKSLVNKKFPERCIIAGSPAKVIKYNRTWHFDYENGTFEDVEN